MKLLRLHDRLGIERFEETLALQKELREQKIADSAQPDMLVLVEHDHVYTTGRSVKFQKTTNEKAQEVPWIEIGRGGQATYHGPGQLVVYPIFDLTLHGKDVHRFLRSLEAVIISTLKRFALDGYIREGLTGVWVNDLAGQPRKVASLGVGIKRWVSFHGMAINVAPDLDYFRAISPCGQDGTTMSSIADLLEQRGENCPTMDEVKRGIVESTLEIFGHSLEAAESVLRLGRPAWLKVRAPGSPDYLKTDKLIRDLRLVTVCEEARCPNIGECWSHHTATFMVMGELCTRRCSFCSVKDGTLESLSPLDPFEPVRVAKAIQELGLEHVVITSVNRDDLEDMGAAHFDATVRGIAHQNPNCRIELLIPDMQGRRELVETILSSGFVSVLNHNVETVPRLYKTVRPGAKLKRSLDILLWAKEIQPDVKTKSGVMVGLGEKPEEVLELMDALRSVDVQILTVGQYLRPSAKQLPVYRYVSPEEFRFYHEEGMKRGFSFVESAPLVRSSYHAWKHVEFSAGAPNPARNLPTSDSALSGH